MNCAKRVKWIGLGFGVELYTRSPLGSSPPRRYDAEEIRTRATYYKS